MDNSWDKGRPHSLAEEQLRLWIVHAHIPRVFYCWGSWGHRLQRIAITRGWATITCPFFNLVSYWCADSRGIFGCMRVPLAVRMVYSFQLCFLWLSAFLGVLFMLVHIWWAMTQESLARKLPSAGLAGVMSCHAMPFQAGLLQHWFAFVVGNEPRIAHVLRHEFFGTETLLSMYIMQYLTLFLEYLNNNSTTASHSTVLEGNMSTYQSVLVVSLL